MSTNEQTAIDDIAFIKKIISDSKNIIIDNGIGFVIWGLIIVVGLLYTYISIVFTPEIRNSYTWFVLIGFGWIYTIISTTRKLKKRRVRTLSGNLLGATWFSAGLSMTIIGFVGTLSEAYSGVFISPLIATILGMAFLISGILLNHYWVSYLSALWWLGAIYMFIFPGLSTILIMALMMLFLQVLPGILLFYKSKQNKDK